MSLEKSIEKKYIYYFKRFQSSIISITVFGLIMYSLYYSISTYMTDERIIDLLCKRNPPTEFLMPGQVIDFEQTKKFKRQKLAQIKVEVHTAQQELLSTIGKGRKDKVDTTLEDSTSWQTVKENLIKIENTFEELLAITFVTYPGQDVEQTVIVGTGSKPINLNDQVLRWQREIEAAAERYQLEPALIAAVIEQESGGNSEAISLAGAIGLMQLMPSTAELMGVNPYDPTQNIEGGTHYLKQQLDSFGNLQAALAAYNAGPGSVENGSWVNIPETMNYVRKVPLRIEKYERIWRENQGRV